MALGARKCMIHNSLFIYSDKLNLFKFVSIIYDIDLDVGNPVYGGCKQQRHRPDYASAQACTGCSSPLLFAYWKESY